MTLRMYAVKYAIPLSGASVAVTLNRSIPEGPTFEYCAEFQGLLSEVQKGQLLSALESCPVRTTLSKSLHFRLCGQCAGPNTALQGDAPPIGGASLNLNVRHSGVPMCIVLQPPFVTMLIATSAWLAHSLFGPWQVLFRVPVLDGVLLVLGFSFMMWARIHFTARKTTLFVGKPSSHLVCEGPFQFSRNPMYVGVVASLLGIALWVGTLPMFMTVPAAFLFLNFFHIPREEQMLRGLFGERYLTYSKEVRRWL